MEEINFRAPSVCDPNDGPRPTSNVEVEDYLHIVRMHVLSACDDLSR